MERKRKARVSIGGEFEETDAQSYEEFRKRCLIEEVSYRAGGSVVSEFRGGDMEDWPEGIVDGVGAGSSREAFAGAADSNYGASCARSGPYGSWSSNHCVPGASIAAPSPAFMGAAPQWRDADVEPELTPARRASQTPSTLVSPISPRRVGDYSVVVDDDDSTPVSLMSRRTNSDETDAADGIKRVAVESVAVRRSGRRIHHLHPLARARLLGVHDGVCLNDMTIIAQNEYVEGRYSVIHERDGSGREPSASSPTASWHRGDDCPYFGFSSEDEVEVIEEEVSDEVEKRLEQQKKIQRAQELEDDKAREGNWRRSM